MKLTLFHSVWTTEFCFFLIREYRDDPSLTLANVTRFKFYNRPENGRPQRVSFKQRHRKDRRPTTNVRKGVLGKEGIEVEERRH